MERENGEIIVILDGVDEISSLTYQSRWSYKASDIVEGKEFVPCVQRSQDDGFFTVDFNRFSETRFLHPSLSNTASVDIFSFEGVRKQIGKTIGKAKRGLRRMSDTIIMSLGTTDCDYSSSENSTRHLRRSKESTPFSRTRGTSPSSRGAKSSRTSVSESRSARSSTSFLTGSKSDSNMDEVINELIKKIPRVRRKSPNSVFNNGSDQQRHTSRVSQKTQKMTESQSIGGSRLNLPDTSKHTEKYKSRKQKPSHSSRRKSLNTLRRRLVKLPIDQSISL